MSNFKLPESIQVVPFEENLRKRKWLSISAYKPPLRSSNYFLNILNVLPLKPMENVFYMHATIFEIPV